MARLAAGRGAPRSRPPSPPAIANPGASSVATSERRGVAVGSFTAPGGDVSLISIGAGDDTQVPHRTRALRVTRGRSNESLSSWTAAGPPMAILRDADRAPGTVRDRWCPMVRAQFKHHPTDRTRDTGREAFSPRSAPRRSLPRRLRLGPRFFDAATTLRVRSVAIRRIHPRNSADEVSADVNDFTRSLQWRPAISPI